MTMQQIFLLAACVYLAVLVATAYFTRATARRVLGALTGGVAVAVVGFGVEFVCQALGFWRYPGDESGFSDAGMDELTTRHGGRRPKTCTGVPGACPLG